MRTLIADTEGNGLIPNLTRMHLLCLRDVDTRETWAFRHNDLMNTVGDGVSMLEQADRIIGHNMLNYDLKAVKKLFPGFKHKAEVLDTLVLARVARPDIGSSDARLVKAGILPGKLAGSHSLKAWGYRLGKHKGDYAEDMEKLGLDPWAAWNQPMEDYCIGDLDVTEVLWHGIQKANLPAMTVDLEHEIHEIMDEVRDNGFPFDIAAANALAPKLLSEARSLHASIVKDYGRKLVPVKKIVVGPLWDDPEGINKNKKYAEPRTELGEDYSRAWWGDVVIPKVNHHDKKKDLPYCPAKWVEFNPGSRDQITDRFVNEHGWNPTDFTVTGKPTVDDATLKKLAELIPAAKPIAELFFINKLSAQVANGEQAWIKYYNPDTGHVHTTTNCGGAVTGRASHSHFNIAQVPSVMLTKEFIDGKPTGREIPLLGRAGEFGWECRSMFGVPKLGDWTQVGVDQSGIEFRCLAELMAEFDGGELIDVIVSGQDIHAYNQMKTGIPSRDIVKRVLYGLLYGAGDYKLGVTANPLLGVAEAEKLGRSLRDALMTGLPALKKAIDRIKKEAKRGYLIGLDGRRLTVRNEYSSLNVRLQSDAALLAKLWVILTRRNLITEGAKIGWDGDFVQMAWIHDEQQLAAYTPFAERCAEIAVAAAAEAGQIFGFKCPIDAKAKLGKTWAECH